MLGILGVIGAIIPLVASIALALFLFLVIVPVFGVAFGRRANAALSPASAQLGWAKASLVLSTVALVIDGSGFPFS